MQAFFISIFEPKINPNEICYALNVATPKTIFQKKPIKIKVHALQQIMRKALMYLFVFFFIYLSFSRVLPL